MFEDFISMKDKFKLYYINKIRCKHYLTNNFCKVRFKIYLLSLY